ncbi:MAG TPA: ABC transporter permease [Ktedonobacteraceae bacterium]|nr:ABC transporter permease [Ktedonobacteraceae bacterium]
MVRSSVITPPTRVVSSVPENPRRYAQRGLLIRANSKAAIKALMANGSRSMLTMLGVIIGVAAVITAVTQAEGTSASINQRFSSLGTNILTVMPGQPPSLSGKGGFVVRLGGSKSSTLTLNDAQALTALAHVNEISPILQTSTTAIFQDENGQFPVYGVSVDYQTIHSLQLAEGSWFSQIDNDTRAPKIVIGANVAQTLFTPLKVDPIGKTVRIGSELFQVIGVLASSSPLVDTNIYAPFNTVQVRLLNATTADQIEVLVDDANNIDQVQQEITDELDKLHRIGGPKTQDFWFQSATQLVQNQQANQASLATLLIGIAAVSLTVGGIGIMNIMLVSVTERTREIGVRMAVGARKSDIRNQFLIEAVLLSAVGGAIGVFFGLFTGYEIIVSSQLPFILDPGAILLAVGVAGLTGIIFGLYPAVRASDLDPIVALRTV